MHAQSARSWSLITHVHVRALHNPLRADSLSSCRWHPHRDAEIFSYVLDGELTHQDSMGNKESLARGGVQYLSAGTGVTHQEMNDGTERCRFIQVCAVRCADDARTHWLFARRPRASYLPYRCTDLHCHMYLDHSSRVWRRRSYGTV